ncbi:carbonic anhydrase [Tilletiaria anomala UBC 951]|uniref:Carbonic anhydrase n=1 Tax=Tilletiaria anomala (strain ATCC 24038 / CBS 436.72 / UBC 951) TaxID=1037660 RepID=A0A066WRR4_TILAU|nr:carbonic anhydrase [Tilletiaria anomala UBC 951]KDN53330.1 carbonic anhydrase [Tilletiaria anomala UBC 951]
MHPAAARPCIGKHAALGSQSVSLVIRAHGTRHHLHRQAHIQVCRASGQAYLFSSRAIQGPIATKIRSMSSTTNFPDQLLARNADWASAVATKEPELLKSSAAGQAPKVLWIGCADSRVPESVVCDAKPGEVFVTRNIANQFNPQDDNAVSVLTYGVQALGVEHVVVVGHTSCGGVNAAIAAASSAADGKKTESPLSRYLTPLVQLAGRVQTECSSLSGPELANQVLEASVKQQVENVVQTDVIQSNWKGEVSPLSNKVMSKVAVHGWIYDVASGKLKHVITKNPV